MGKRPPLQLSAAGDRSLMWVCHITGTPGCSTPKVDKPALSRVTTVVAPRGVPASTNEVLPASTTQNSGNKDSRSKTRGYLVKRQSCDVTSTAEPPQLDATPQGIQQDSTHRRCDACSPQMLPRLQHSTLRRKFVQVITCTGGQKGWTLPSHQKLCRGTARERTVKC